MSSSTCHQPYVLMTFTWRALLSRDLTNSEEIVDRSSGYLGALAVFEFPLYQRFLFVHDFVTILHYMVLESTFKSPLTYSNPVGFSR